MAGTLKWVFPATVVAAWAASLPTRALHSWPSTEGDVSGIFLFLPQNYRFNASFLLFMLSNILPQYQVGGYVEQKVGKLRQAEAEGEVRQ